jgi:hypothetical protein
MEEFDFRWCEFIDIEMSFVTFEDFLNKCTTIKEIYKELGRYQKRFYKWYVYANINIKEVVKNAIWEYLNYDDVYYYLELVKYRGKK